MCLSKVTRTYKTPTKRIEEGWKLFSERLESSKLRAYVKYDYYKEGTWINFDDSMKQEPGFYAFRKQEDAKRYQEDWVRVGRSKGLLKKIIFSGVVIEGESEPLSEFGPFLDTVVVKRFLIPIEKDEE